MTSSPRPPTAERLRELREGLGTRLRRVREGLLESQVVFSDRLGVGKLSLINYEAGKTTPTCDVLCQLVDQDIDAHYIAFGTPSLDSREQRDRFAAVHAWVTREFKIRFMALDDKQIMDVAWRVFVQLSKSTDSPVPDLGMIDRVIQDTVREDVR